MVRRLSRSARTDTRFAYTTLFRALSTVRTYSICLSSGTSALASVTAGGSLPDRLPSGPRYWRYSISNFAAMVIAILVLGGIVAGPDRACPRGARWTIGRAHV